MTEKPEYTEPPLVAEFKRDLLEKFRKYPEVSRREILEAHNRAYCDLWRKED